jgi:hypothetical protein
MHGVFVPKKSKRLHQGCQLLEAGLFHLEVCWAELALLAVLRQLGQTHSAALRLQQTSSSKENNDE